MKIFSTVHANSVAISARIFIAKKDFSKYEKGIFVFATLRTLSAWICFAGKQKRASITQRVRCRMSGSPFILRFFYTLLDCF